MIRILFYDKSCRKVVRVGSYARAELANRAIARAAKRGQVAQVAHTRGPDDPPTCHH